MEKFVQRAIDKLLVNHQNYAAGYIDDISVFSFDWKQHIVDIEKVLKEFLENGMTVKLKKCFF